MVVISTAVAVALVAGSFGIVTTAITAGGVLGAAIIQSNTAIEIARINKQSGGIPTPSVKCVDNLVTAAMLYDPESVDLLVPDGVYRYVGFTFGDILVDTPFGATFGIGLSTINIMGRSASYAFDVTYLLFPITNDEGANSIDIGGGESVRFDVGFLPIREDTTPGLVIDPMIFQSNSFQLLAKDESGEPIRAEWRVSVMRS